MLFNSIEFLFIFLPIVFIVYNLINKLGYKRFSNLWLAIASLYFYSYYKIEYLPIMITSILFNYLVSNLILKDYSHKVKKFILVFSIIGNLGLLCYFKYFNFLIETFNSLNLYHFDTMKIMLPLGISFFTFQQISFVYDTYKGEAGKVNFIDYTLFVSFFPQLIAGPICVYKELVPQFQDFTKKVINRENIYKAIFFITIGLAKKVLLADNFSRFINDVLQYEGMTEFFTSWCFALAVGIQGYFDFSGYCDIAIGLALLFNIDIPINFDSPYKSLDISDYWRRWHITMGRFLKYHVYIPMGGSRRGTLRTYWNLFFVFFVTGVWHGANWPCILYGVLNGIFVSINKLWKKTEIQMHKYLAIAITFITMIFIAPLMRIQLVHQYFLTVKAMLGINTPFVPAVLENFNLVFSNPQFKLNSILLVVSLLIIFCCNNTNEVAPKYVQSKNMVSTFALVILFVISVLSITKGSEFIYFNF